MKPVGFMRGLPPGFPCSSASWSSWFLRAGYHIQPERSFILQQAPGGGNSSFRAPPRLTQTSILDLIRRPAGRIGALRSVIYLRRIRDHSSVLAIPNPGSFARSQPTLNPKPSRTYTLRRCSSSLCPPTDAGQMRNGISQIYDTFLVGGSP